MKPLYLLAASALALTAGACAPKTPPARAALDCPTHQGDLTRTSASPDGKACTYTTSEGSEVTLQLVSLQGGVDNTLAGIEKVLLANRAPPAAEAKAEAPAKADGKTEASAARAEAEAQADAKGGVQVRADIDGDVSVDSDLKIDGKKADGVNVEVKGGRTVVSESDDGVTRVNLPGIHIVANDRDDTAKVQVGPFKIDAGGDDVTFRMRRDVRLRGEALSTQKRGVRATFLYAGDDLPGGYRFVGYEAGGPKRGPITVAIVKSKREGHGGDEIYPDVKKLVRRNGGV